MKVEETVSWTGADIKILRLRLGLTPSMLAQRLCCAVELIHQWESENKTPDRDYLFQLQGLQNIADKNSQKTAQSPHIDAILNEQGLEQIYKDGLE